MHFTVVKEAARPFVVVARQLEVRAVGTAFNVNLRATTVDVLVTEGKVRLETPPPAMPSARQSGANALSAPSVVGACQRAVVPLVVDASSAPIVVRDVPPAEIERALAWQSRLLRLGGASLAELALEFQQQTGRRIVLADPELAERRIGGRFRADDVEGFIRLLETHFDVVSQRTPEGVIVLLRRP